MASVTLEGSKYKYTMTIPSPLNVGSATCNKYLSEIFTPVITRSSTGTAITKYFLIAATFANSFNYMSKDYSMDSSGEYGYALATYKAVFAANSKSSTVTAMSNTSVFDSPYFEALFGGSEFPDGTFMIDYEEEIIEFQTWYMEVMAEIRSENMFTFPVSTISLLRKEGNFDLNSLDAYEDREFAEWAITHNMKWSDSNIFQDTSVNSLSNCCRLKSDIRDLGYFNSIGGTALKVGSVKVSTINLARIALDTDTEAEYIGELARRTLVNIRALDVVRNIIKRDVQKDFFLIFHMD